MESSTEPKIYPPSDKKLNDLKKKGQFPKTEMTEGFFQIIYFFILFIMFFIIIYNYFDYILVTFLSSNIIKDAEYFVLIVFLLISIMYVLKIVLFSLNWAIISNAIITTEPLGFKIDKINPVQGVKNNYGFTAVIKSFRSILSLIFLIFSIKYIADVFDKKLYLFFQINNKSYFIYIFIQFFCYLTAFFLIYAIIIGTIDFMFEKFNFMKKNRMTLTEMKKEMKDTEGSPEIKQERKKVMQEIAADTPDLSGRKPNFAVANPNHILIPICFNSKIDSRPIVLKITIDNLALQNKKKLEEEDIPIFEDQKLAQEMLKSMKTGEKFIDEKFFKHVALILAFLKRKALIEKNNK